MSEFERKKLDEALACVAPSRRGFLRKLVAAALAAGTLAAPASELMAADSSSAGQDPGKGKGKAKGKAKGKGKGKGKAKGKAKAKGKGKNPSSFTRFRAN